MEQMDQAFSSSSNTWGERNEEGRLAERIYSAEVHRAKVKSSRNCRVKGLGFRGVKDELDVGASANKFCMEELPRRGLNKFQTTGRFIVDRR